MFYFVMSVFMHCPVILDRDIVNVYSNALNFNRRCLHLWTGRRLFSDIHHNHVTFDINCIYLSCLLYHVCLHHRLPPWCRHEMTTFSAWLAFCTGNSPVAGEFRLSMAFFDLGLNKRLSKQWRRRRFETPSPSLWRHCNAYSLSCHTVAFTNNKRLHNWHRYRIKPFAHRS